MDKIEEKGRGLFISDVSQNNLKKTVFAVEGPLMFL
ncbi:MAG: hypothetical protein CM15mP45_08030 [Deltaproteobacteria bacterium]|nr:MAG: hypothetical protein CM15mP45_08030 [Deltaproteobacteria bacterium]